MTSSKKTAWSIDQLAKSEFFHQKLHEWQLLDIAYQIDEIKGETLEWNLEKLQISKSAWNKAIHRGIKPVIIFANPQVLMKLAGAVGYYRMLSMVSQKSMSQVGLPTVSYEQTRCFPGEEIAWAISQHLNKIISHLVASDEKIDVREFDLWRGMAAGTQAQGSWQNAKVNQLEVVIKGIIKRRINDLDLVSNETADGLSIELKDGRKIVFSDEPDMAIYRESEILVAVEIKGGIDHAGVLERVGAAIKSLSRAKKANSESMTVLILQAVSVTEKAIEELNTHKDSVNYWFMVEDVLENEVKKEELFTLLDL